MVSSTPSPGARYASHVAVAMPSGSGDLESARAFLQDRLRQSAFWVFILSFGFYLMNIATSSLISDAMVPGHSVLQMQLEPGNLFHLAASLLFCALWLAMRHPSPVPFSWLRFLDAAALVVGCTWFALMGRYLFVMQQSLGFDPSIGLFAGLLASANVVMGRAIFVPSTPARTLAVSTAALLPMLPVTALATGSASAVVNVACWATVSIAIATVGSRVIFGLRKEAARVRRLGQYTLEEKIGAGGMGVVYRASHAMLRRPTAIKLLPPERAGVANLLRFEREVQLTSQLSHPNTIAIYDYGRTPDGLFYYAMEYLDGINLDDLVHRYGPQPAGRVVAILDQVCGALSEAHRRGLVHRDIKPANVILTERGGEPDVAKVVDFGLVRPLEPGNADATQSTSVLTGTPLYMSPESLSAPESSDPRSDLYAVGAVGYFLLTGQPVFEGTSVFDIVGHHLHSEPAPPSQRTTHPVPSDLEAVILSCLRKDPAERPSDAAALRGDLRGCGMVRVWTTEDAATWWRAFRSVEPPAATRPSAAGAAGLTVSVDIGDRLTQAITRG
ncbi:MAG: serine/threonine-protein kinase [Vicinamibacterales bacterium]